MFFLKKEKIRTRFAPSPTGLFHIGNVRTALFNFLFAKKFGGKFILRIEDTDFSRYKPEYEKDIFEALQWLGINWDEGPYKQSERLDIYSKYIRQLLNNNDAFYCFHSKEFLEQEREEQIKNKSIPCHNCEFKKIPAQDTEKRLSKQGALVRFRAPVDFVISFHDLIRGEIRFNSNTLGGDFSLAKTEGREFLPLYNLAVVVDDFEMNISHVIRGEDHISNTPKQILIQRALGLPTPKYAHLPLIFGSDKSKLSKRHAAVSVTEYREAGYLPEALLNFIALLGWNPGTDKEIFDLKELMEEFNLDKVQKSGAVFNIEKLDWLNGHYLRQLSVEQLAEKTIPFLEKSGLINGGNYDLAYIKKILSLEQTRLKNLKEAGDRLFFFFKQPEYQPELLIWRDMLFKDIVASLKISLEALNKIEESEFTRDNLERTLLKEAERAKNKDKGRLLWPLRVALTGLEASPGPFEILEVLGKKESIKRIETAIKL